MPQVATAGQALLSARSYLNDLQPVAWSDAVLMPMLQEAHRELSVKLIANGVNVIRQQSAVITVPALAPGQPSPIVMPGVPVNLIVPISLYERDPSTNADDFIQMKQVDFVPIINPVSDLIFWAYLNEQIWVVGATSTKEVEIRYRGSLLTPVTVNDSIGIAYGELYLGPRIASIAMPGRQDFKDTADTNLFTIVQYNVTGEQGVPKRKQGYRRAGWRRRFIY